MTQVVHIPFRSRVNIRMIVFLAIIGGIVGFPVYTYLKNELTGGVTVRKDGYLEVDLKTMSSFPLDQENGTLEDIPKQWRALDGKKVVLVGEMWSDDDAGTSLWDFDLVYSIAKCCLDGAPQIQHFIKAVPAQKGAKIPYFNGMVEVKGTLHIDLKKSEGKIVKVFGFDVEGLEPI